jgi:hypothetical protein
MVPSGKVTTIFPLGKMWVLADMRRARRASSSARLGTAAAEAKTGAIRSDPGAVTSPDRRVSAVAMTMQLTLCSTTVS